MEAVSLWEKNSWWAKFLKNWSKKRHSRPFGPIGSYGVLWIPSTTNVLPLSGGNNEGGYGVVCKVQIKKFDHIPNTIELARKTPNTNDKWEARKQWLVEALACSCELLGSIKFLAIHIETMEAYVRRKMPISDQHIYNYLWLFGFCNKIFALYD